MSNNKQYEKTNTIGLYIKLNKKSDADVIEALNSVSNKQGFIKELIRYSLDPDNSCAVLCNFLKAE